MLTSDMTVEISTQLFRVLRYYGEDPAGKEMAPLTKASREKFSFRHSVYAPLLILFSPWQELC